jgi:hypothetical protein
MVKDLIPESVHRYASLEMGEDKDFLEILDLALTVCKTSFAFIALLDGEHLYLKRVKGLKQVYQNGPTAFASIHWSRMMF